MPFHQRIINIFTKPIEQIEREIEKLRTKNDRLRGRKTLGAAFRSEVRQNVKTINKMVSQNNSMSKAASKITNHL